MAPEVRTFTSDIHIKGRLRVDGTVFGLAETLEWVNVRDYGAVGNLATDDTVSIQAAINVCPTLGVVYIPPGQYLLSNTLVLTKPITVMGAGCAGTVLYALASMASTKDVLHLVPSGDGECYQILDLAIAKRTTACARHAIYLDGVSGEAIKDAVIRNVVVGELNPTSRAVYADGPGVVEGNPSILTIEQCIFQGGIEIAQCGDTVRVVNSHISGKQEALKVTFLAGASTLTFQGNNANSEKGIYVGGAAIAVEIIGNKIETTASFTGSNGALVDIDGAVGAHATETMVCRNSFQVLNSITADAIRVNFADRTYIQGNRFGRGIGASHDVTVTANATDTVIGDNLWPVGVPYASMVNDAGTRTMFVGAFSGEFRSHVRHAIAGVSAVETELIRLGRTTDDQRYNSIKSVSTSSTGSRVSVFIHDGVTGTSQKGAMGWDGNGYTVFHTLPPVFANNAAAVAGGLVSGYVYRTGADPDVVCVVHP